MTIEKILRLARTYSEHVGLSIHTVSTYAANDGKLFKNFAEKDAQCTVRRAEMLVQWFSDNWPTDLGWPNGIDRPSPRKAAS
jgi:hypothetical protein